ncbi:parathyroid hormone 1a [Anabas testudineus]|nr:parathyroid hormone 1a [Anabas testudineus]
MQNLDYKILFLLFCILYLAALCEGRPIRKRTVSEVQLMHNFGEHKQVQARQEWLQLRLRGIHTAPARDSSEEVDWAKSRLHPEELPNLTPEEIQYALNYLEKLLKSKQS